MVRWLCVVTLVIHDNQCAIECDGKYAQPDEATSLLLYAKLESLTVQLHLSSHVAVLRGVECSSYAFAADQQQSSLTEVVKDRCKRRKSTSHIVAELPKHGQAEHNGADKISLQEVWLAQTGHSLGHIVLSVTSVIICQHSKHVLQVQNSFFTCAEVTQKQRLSMMPLPVQSSATLP